MCQILIIFFNSCTMVAVSLLSRDLFSFFYLTAQILVLGDKYCRQSVLSKCVFQIDLEVN